MIPSAFDFLSRSELEGLMKLAEQKPIKSPWGHAVGTVGKGLVGFGAGTVGGFALGHLADAVFEKTTGQKVPSKLLVPAASLLGAGMGLAYSLYKSKESEELRRAYEAHRDNAKRSVSLK